MSLASFVLVSLGAASGALAQQVPLGPVSPIGLGPVGGPPARVAPQGMGFRPRVPNAFNPGFYGGYYGGYGYGGYPVGSTQNVLVVQQPPPVVMLPPAPPPEPVRAEISEVKPASTNPPAPQQQSESKMFGIVLKDGMSLDASAVSFQEGGLLIVDAEGDHRRIPLTTVDRDATRRVNRERGLQLAIPVR